MSVYGPNDTGLSTSICERVETWLLSRLNQITGSNQPIKDPFTVEAFAGIEDAARLVQDGRTRCPGGFVSMPTVRITDDGNRLTRYGLDYQILVALPLDRATFDTHRRFLLRMLDRLTMIAQHQVPTTAEFPKALGHVDFLRSSGFTAASSADRVAGLYTFAVQISRINIPYTEGL